jgi:hypothetical protein
MTDRSCRGRWEGPDSVPDVGAWLQAADVLGTEGPALCRSRRSRLFKPGSGVVRGERPISRLQWPRLGMIRLVHVVKS